MIRKLALVGAAALVASTFSMGATAEATAVPITGSVSGVQGPSSFHTP